MKVWFVEKDERHSDCPFLIRSHQQRLEVTSSRSYVIVKYDFIQCRPDFPVVILLKKNNNNDKNQNIKKSMIDRTAWAFVLFFKNYWINAFVFCYNWIWFESFFNAIDHATDQWNVYFTDQKKTFWWNIVRLENKLFYPLILPVVMIHFFIF